MDALNRSRPAPGARRARSDARGAGPRTRRGIQIGPRIRIGGSIGKAGQKLKEGVGKVAKVAAPVVSFFNPALGAGMGALGTALDTSQGSVGLGSIAKSAAMNGGIGALGKLPGAAKLGGMVSKVPGVGAVTGGVKSAYDMAKGALPESVQKLAGSLFSGAGGDGKGSFGALGDFLGQHGDKLLMGGAVASSYLDQKANRELRERALKYATDSFDSRAALRTAGMQGALNPERPDLGGIFADPGNVYAKPAAPAPATAPAGGIVRSGAPPTWQLLKKGGSR